MSPEAVTAVLGVASLGLGGVLANLFVLGQRPVPANRPAVRTARTMFRGLSAAALGFSVVGAALLAAGDRERFVPGLTCLMMGLTTCWLSGIWRGRLLEAELSAADLGLRPDP